MINKDTTHRIILTTITSVFVLFIFINSMMAAEVSSANSTGVMQFLNNLLSNIGIQSNLTEHFVRKSAHFIEYFVLGALLIATTRVYTQDIFGHIFKVLFIGLAVPVVDEFIQLFAQNRSSQVDDIMRDFLGALVGMAIAIFVCYIRNRFFRKSWWR